MARTFSIPTLLDDDDRAIVNAWCRPIRLDTQALVDDTQYTDKNGDATFTALPDDVDCVIVCTWIDETGKERTRRILSEAHPTMDEVRQGANYAKVHIEDLTADHIHLGSAQGNSDDISEGASHKWDTGAPPTILDQLNDGTYGKVLAEDIDITSHHVKLSATVESSSANYVTNNEKTGAGDGYDFFESKLTAYGLSIKSSVSSTRIELTAAHIAGYNSGVLQFEVKANDGKAYFAGGKATLEATGLRFNNATGAEIAMAADGIPQVEIYLKLSTQCIAILSNNGIILPRIRTELEPFTDELTFGATDRSWGTCYMRHLGTSTRHVYTAHIDDIIANDFEPFTNLYGSLGTSSKRYGHSHIHHADFYGMVNLHGLVDVLSTLDCTAGQVCLPRKVTTGHPDPAETSIYVNTFDNLIACYADGDWRTLASW